MDAERSLNSGNWLWLSGSTYVREHIPWMCPVEVGKKLDPTGEYVRCVGKMFLLSTLKTGGAKFMLRLLWLRFVD